jgi:hypothetical protein
MRSYTRSSKDPSAPIENRWMNQRKWGFRIYRTTYEDDEQWSTFLTRFKSSIKIRKPWREQDVTGYNNQS